MSIYFVVCIQSVIKKFFIVKTVMMTNPRLTIHYMDISVSLSALNVFLFMVI